MKNSLELSSHWLLFWDLLAMHGTEPNSPHAPFKWTGACTHHFLELSPGSGHSLETLPQQTPSSLQ